MIGVVGTACVTFMDFTLDGADDGPNGGGYGVRAWDSATVDHHKAIHP